MCILDKILQEEEKKEGEGKEGMTGIDKKWSQEEGRRTRRHEEKIRRGQVREEGRAWWSKSLRRGREKGKTKGDAAGKKDTGREGRTEERKGWDEWMEAKDWRRQWEILWHNAGYSHAITVKMVVTRKGERGGCNGSDEKGGRGEGRGYSFPRSLFDHSAIKRTKTFLPPFQSQLFLPSTITTTLTTTVRRPLPPPEV
jgi:hypothetical protein